MEQSAGRPRNPQIDEAVLRATTELLERMNASGRLFVSHTKLHGKYGIRIAIGNGATEWRHVEQVLHFVDGRA